jgi:hypothetical protein
MPGGVLMKRLHARAMALPASATPSGRIARAIGFAALQLAACASAVAGNFYLFPVQEIEGVFAQAQPARPMIDQRVVQLVFGGDAGRATQRAVVEHFVASLNRAYPASVIHPKQVYDVNIGSGHKFVNNNDLACKQAPSYNVADTYAVVAGITRASIYTVTRGDNVEVLIPLTLSLQFIKPSLAKIVYTISETTYSPFRLSRAEYESGAADGIMRAAVLKHIAAQVSSLVASAQAAFNPKDVTARLVGKDGAFYVVDKGIEAGFVKGEQVEADDAAGKTSIFDVLYADSGYAVLKPVAGAVSVGDSLKFTFETAADDSRKPRLMPVVSSSADTSWASSTADIFARDIGFKASFQLSPVDVNFSQTKELVTRAANCVSWQNLPSMTEASGVRKDPPNFFLRFTPAISPLTTLTGIGGTRTADMFHTLVTAQVIDQFGKVVYSDLGDNDYAIDKVNGDGLGFEQAREISLKNATRKLAQNFIANVKFTPKDYQIVKVDGGKVWVEGLAGIAPTEQLSFDLLHPLDAKVGGKPAMLDIDAGYGAGNLEANGDLVGLPYSAVNPAMPKPRSGDLVRLYAQAVPGVSKIIDCDEAPYVGQNNIADGNYLVPLIQHTIYQSKKFASYVGAPRFYADANSLLRQGLFDLQLKPPAHDVCSQPGYAIREESLACADPQNCKATVSIGVVARLKKGSDILKSFSTGLRTDFSGFPSASKSTFYGYKQLGNGLSMQAELLKKINLN